MEIQTTTGSVHVSEILHEIAARYQVDIATTRALLHLAQKALGMSPEDALAFLLEAGATMPFPRVDVCYHE